LVQDSTIERLGRVEAARSDASIAIEGLTFERAVETRPDSDPAEVWFIAIETDARRWDALARIETIPAIRAAAGLRPDQVTVIADDPANPLLRLRLLRAGVSLVLSASQVRRASSWFAALDGSLGAASVEVRDFERAILSIGRSSDPASALRWIAEEGYQAAFTGARTQEGTGLSRRAILRIRTEVTRRGDLYVPASHDTGGSMRPSQVAHWRDVVAFVNLARAASPADDVDLPRCCGQD
jgi:hypothetical protein